jgi:hypothetical protein
MPHKRQPRREASSLKSDSRRSVSMNVGTHVAISHVAISHVMISHVMISHVMISALERLPTAVVAQIFSWLDVNDHLALYQCARFLGTASRLRASSCESMSVRWYGRIKAPVPFRWSPRELTVYNDYPSQTLHISKRAITRTVKSIYPPLQSLRLYHVGTPRPNMLGFLRHLFVHEGHSPRRMSVNTCVWWRVFNASCHQLETLDYSVLDLETDTFTLDTIKPHATLRKLRLSSIQGGAPELTFLDNIAELTVEFVIQRPMRLENASLKRLIFLGDHWRLRLFRKQKQHDTIVSRETSSDPEALVLAPLLQVSTLELKHANLNVKSEGGISCCQAIWFLTPNLTALHVSGIIAVRGECDWFVLNQLTCLRILDLEGIVVGIDTEYCMPYIPSVTEFRAPGRSSNSIFYMSLVAHPPHSTTHIEPTLSAFRVALPKEASASPKEVSASPKEVSASPTSIPCFGGASDPQYLQLAFPNLEKLQWCCPRRTHVVTYVDHPYLRSDNRGIDDGTFVPDRNYAAFRLDNIPSHPHLRHLYVGNYLIDHQDLTDLLGPERKTRHPRLETITGSEMRYNFPMSCNLLVPRSTLHEDARTSSFYVCLGALRLCPPSYSLY